MVVPIGQLAGAHSVPAAYSWQPPAPLQTPFVAQLTAPLSRHWPAGSGIPAATAEQVPALPEIAHDMQVPAQVVWQQVPWAQMPLLHSVPSPQVAPLGLRPHDPPTHTPGGAQSASAVQDDLHMATPQRNGKQEVAAGVTQVPAPSQLAPGVNVVVFAGQVAGLQGVPCAYFWQAPAWHRPLLPQLVEPASRQVPVGSAVPSGTFVHRPIDVDSAQDLQALAQGEAQQTPWAQLPDAHSFLSAQKAPSGLRPQELFWQTLPVTQLSSAVQATKQRAPLHTKGAQAVASGLTQAPVALQVPGGV